MSVDPKSVGSGFLGPSDYHSDFAAISFIVRQAMLRLRTMVLVQVQAVHGGGGAIATAGTVDVIPLVCQVDGEGNAIQSGTYYGLPWWRLQGGHGAVIADPAVNDIGYVMCADRDTSKVLKQNGQLNGRSFVNNGFLPGSARRFSIPDGIYVGGCLNGIPTQYLAFTSNGLRVADLNGNVIQMGPSGITITGNVAVTGSISATGNISTTVEGAPITLGLHVHPANGSPPTPGS